MTALTQEEILSMVNEIVTPWEKKDGNLIGILHEIQNRFSYVPRDISFAVAKRMSLPLARIYEVITFFNYFKLEAPGKHVVSVCLGTACYLKRSKDLVAKLKEEIGIGPGETTPDKNFHVQEVRCLGCCGQAPVMTVGHKVYGRLTTDSVPEIIKEYAHLESKGVS